MKNFVLFVSSLRSAVAKATRFACCALAPCARMKPTAYVPRDPRFRGDGDVGRRRASLLRAPRRWRGRKRSNLRASSSRAAHVEGRAGPVDEAHVSRAAFTLIELFISIAIFGTVTTLIADIYIQSVRVENRSILARQLYDDTRYIMGLIEDEIRNGAVDYDEYYNRNVVMAAVNASPPAIPNSAVVEDTDTYGQNFGRYYSSFFNPGGDNSLGYNCNDGTRNAGSCTPLRNTLDRITGQNPYVGKGDAATSNEADENVFCGSVFYGPANTAQTYYGVPSPTNPVDCVNTPPPQSELYMINQDGSRKTILARELVGPATNAVSMLRMSGVDGNGDRVFDAFVCAPEFECLGSLDVVPADNGFNNSTCGGVSFGEAPRSPTTELEQLNASGQNCENLQTGFNKDFVPISPLRIDIQSLVFYISPLEDPHYAFAENDVQQQPMVTVVMTAAPSADYASSIKLPPITFVKTVMVGIERPIPAPLLEA